MTALNSARVCHILFSSYEANQGKTLNSVNSRGGWNWLRRVKALPCFCSIHSSSQLIVISTTLQPGSLPGWSGWNGNMAALSLSEIAFYPSLAKTKRCWSRTAKIRVSSARLMTLPHPSGRPPSPVITPLIVRGWQPFCCRDTRHRLQSNETWRESGNLLAQIFEMQTISITASFLLSVCASQCVAFFCVPAPRMLCRRTSPRDKSQNDSLDRELSRREE